MFAEWKQVRANIDHHAHSVSYRRTPRLLSELAIARADGSYPKLLASLAKTEVLVRERYP